MSRTATSPSAVVEGAVVENSATRSGAGIDQDHPTGRLGVVVRAIFAFGVLGLSLGRAFDKYSTEIPFGGSAWSAGEWLVNYGGGFVRRGLFGEIFLAVAPPGLAGLWVLFAFQMFLVAVIVFYALQVLHRTRYSWSSIALVCGPASLPFMGWGDSSFHKEALPLVVLAILAWSRWTRRRRWEVVTLVIVAVLLFSLAVFSWEASALLLPAIGYLLLAPRAPHPGLDIFRRSAAVIFAVVAAVGAGVSTVAHGDVSTAQAICDTVREKGFVGSDICGAVHVSGGGIEAIGWTPDKAAQDLAVAFPVYIGFVPFILLALLPLFGSRWFRSNWAWAAVIALGILPLYFVVTDYGRWTHILVLTFMFVMTAGDPRGAHSRMWTGFGTLLYVAMWGLPHWVYPQTDFWPYLGLAPTLVDYSIEALWILMGRPT